VKTAREKAEEARQAKLDLVREQVQTGELVIRQMTDGERRRYPPRRRRSDRERLVEGLQDSVHRESKRHAKLIAELQAQIQPGAMGAALARDARSRGL
jgi:dihydroorotase-like cyclic amidohydrolase